MISKVEKQKIIDDLSDKFKKSPSIFVVEYKGLKVGETESIREQLKNVDAELKIVKNTLLKRASVETDIEEIKSLFLGPTAIAICEKDSPKVAKVFVDSIRKLPALKIKGGIVESKVVGVEEIEEISKLPSREELIARFSGLLNSPMSNFVRTLKQMQTKLVFVLNALKEKKKD